VCLVSGRKTNPPRCIRKQNTQTSKGGARVCGMVIRSGWIYLRLIPVSTEEEEEEISGV
jgi:hypothetical protein